MPMMNYYEPLFLLLLLSAVGTLLTAAGFAVTGRFARAGKMLWRLGIGAVVYMTIVIGVTLVERPAGVSGGRTALQG